MTAEKPSIFQKKWIYISIVVIALAARLIPGPRTIDDSYITFRYARNVLAGEGLVYNPGEPVLGTTTPLYAGLLVLAGTFLGGVEAPFPEIAMVINAVADSLTCLLLIYLGRRNTVPLAGFASALAWAIHPYSVTFSIGGLETSLVVLLMTACMAAYLDNRFVLTAFLASLSLLTRPDTLLLLVPLGLDRIFVAIRKGERVSLQETGAFLFPALTWALPAAQYYGTPLPNSIAAKTSAYMLPPEQALIRFLQHYATPFMDNLTFGSTMVLLLFALYIFFILIGSWRLMKSNPRTWPWIFLPWGWFAAYAYANPLIFRWYLTPPLPVYIFMIFAGAAYFLEDLRKSFRPPVLEHGIVILLLLAPLTLISRAWVAAPDHGLKRPAPKMAWYELEIKYHQAGTFLKPLLNENDVIAAGDIGVLGYETNAIILDTLGLISPQAIQYNPTNPDFYVIGAATSPDLIHDLQPEYIVLLEVYGREGLFKNSQFQNTYDLILRIETNIYDSDGMLIFARTTAE